MKWTSKDDQASKGQGWIISHTGRAMGHPLYEVEKLDDDSEGGKIAFEWDDDAQAFVDRQAATGDPLAQKALAFLEEHNKE